MAQEKETTKTAEIQEISSVPVSGRLLGLDPGTRRIGVAVTDETRTVVRPLPRIDRVSWKKVLLRIKDIVAGFDAAAVVVGLPLTSEGSESEMSAEARDVARKLSLSLDIPVFLQDERASSYEAKRRLWEQGVDLATTRDAVDSEAAVIILEDFLSRLRA